MTYEEIVSATQKELFAGDLTGFSGDFAIQVNIVGEGGGAFYIAYKHNNLDIAPYEYIDKDAALIASADTFLKISEGKLDSVAAFTAGKLKVEGSIDKALELQRMIGVMKSNEKKASKKK